MKVATPNPVRWLFTPPPFPTPGRAILWWELRRIPVNLLVGAYGVACLAVFLEVWSWSGGLAPGEDAVEPMAVMLVPIGFNLCYTLGWMTESTVRTANRTVPPDLGPRLLRLGLLFTLAVLTLPPALALAAWGVRVMR